MTGNTVWQTTTDRGEGSFGDLDVATYDLEVNAVGCVTVHKEVKVLGPLAAYHEEIVLQPGPSSVGISAPGASQLPKETRKIILQGVSALKSGDYKTAEKELEAARKLVPDSEDVNFLLGDLAFEQKRFDVAKYYLRRDLLHEKLDASGSPTTKETRKFNYVAPISESAPRDLEVNEFRSERSGLDDLPASNGFMSLAFIFHPLASAEPDLYFNFRNRRYFRRHSLDHFMLFSMDSAESATRPKSRSRLRLRHRRRLPN